MSNSKTGLDGRVRDHDGEIRHKRSDTKISTLREIYGKNVAPGFRSDAKLGTVLNKTGAHSLSGLIKNKSSSNISSRSKDYTKRTPAFYKANTRDFKEIVQERALRDKEFREGILRESIECMLSGDIMTGKALLRDYINATVGFDKLSKLTKKDSKSLMRMFSINGNPTANNLFEVIQILQENEGVHYELQTINKNDQNAANKFLGSTVFVLKAPEAKSVYVTGSFNDWSLDENCRMSNKDGIWNLKINLKPGIYKYQFIVDGKWQEDPTNIDPKSSSSEDSKSFIKAKS